LGVPNSKNKVLSAPDLTSGFTTLSNVTADASGSFRYEDTNPSNLNAQLFELSTREPF